MRDFFSWVMQAVRSVWSAASAIYICAWFLALRILDAYVVPAIRRLLGKN